MSALRLDLTSRGFPWGGFFDRYGQQCSVQDSSLADEDCIWLGVDEVSGAPARMHLTQDMAAALVPILQGFVETGSIATPAGSRTGSILTGRDDQREAPGVPTASSNSPDLAALRELLGKGGHGFRLEDAGHFANIYAKNEHESSYVVAFDVDRDDAALMVAALENLNVFLSIAEENGRLREARNSDREWFWRIVDADGLADVSSEEEPALQQLVARAARAEKAEAEAAALRGALERIAHGMEFVFDEELQDDVEVWTDSEALQDIARSALNSKGA